MTTTSTGPASTGPASTGPAPTGRRRNPRGEGARLREEIIAAAAGLLEEHGNEDAVTLRAVARRVGIAAPSIYAHFPDRDSIVDAVVGRAFDELAAAVHEASEVEPDPRARLHGICAAYLAFAEQRPHRYRVLFGRHRLDLGGGPPARSLPDLAGAEAFGTLLAGIGACVEAGCSGSQTPMLDATAVWAALHGYASLRSGVPAFPWPDRAVLLARLVDRLAALEPPAAGAVEPPPADAAEPPRPGPASRQSTRSGPSAAVQPVPERGA